MIQGFSIVIRGKCAKYQVKTFHSIDNFLASLCYPRLKPGTCEFLFCSPFPSNERESFTWKWYADASRLYPSVELPFTCTRKNQVYFWACIAFYSFDMQKFASFHLDNLEGTRAAKYRYGQAGAFVAPAAILVGLTAHPCRTSGCLVCRIDGW